MGWSWIVNVRQKIYFWHTKKIIMRGTTTPDKRDAGGPAAAPEESTKEDLEYLTTLI